MPGTVDALLTPLPWDQAFNSVMQGLDVAVFMAEVSKVIDEQIRLEEETQQKLAETAKLVEEAWAKMILDGIRMDTAKHAVVLRSLKAALAQKPSETYEEKLARYADPLAARKAFEEHLAIEEDMVKRASELAEQVPERKAQAVLLQIVDEEKRHHKAIGALLKGVYGLKTRR